MMVKKADLAKHLESECPCRLVTCSYCHADISADQMEVSIVLYTCMFKLKMRHIKVRVVVLLVIDCISLSVVKIAKEKTRQRPNPNQ